MTDRQHDIIDAAGRILTRSGVTGLTIKNLATEMGFTEAAVYRHFKSKEDIIVAMLEHLLENAGERCQAVSDSGFPPDLAFLELFRSHLRYFKAHPHFVVAVFSDGLLEESGRINDTLFKILGVNRMHLVPILVRGQQQGVFTAAMSPDQLVQLVMGSFRMEMFKWRIAQFKYDIETQGDSMLKAILALITQK
jgi:TetR/AcrR family transcriptional regulator, fatty acid metabolism regulator protein